MKFKALTTQEEWKWLDKRASPTRDEFSQGIVAYDDKGKICAAFLACGFSHDGCEVHLAIDNPMAIRRGFLHECLGYIFNTRSRKRAFGLVPSDNAKALKFNRHIGFSEVARIPDGYATGVDYVVMRMEAEGNPWVTIKQPQEIKAA